jgi:hypothetical protein
MHSSRIFAINAELTLSSVECFLKMEQYGGGVLDKTDRAIFLSLSCLFPIYAVVNSRCGRSTETSHYRRRAKRSNEIFYLIISLLSRGRIN